MVDLVILVLLAGTESATRTRSVSTAVGSATLVLPCAPTANRTVRRKALTAVAFVLIAPHATMGSKTKVSLVWTAGGRARLPAVHANAPQPAGLLALR